MIVEWISFIIAAIFIIVGIVILAIGVLGVYRFHFVLNRMHAAALGDTFGIASVLIGVMILSGFTFTTLKILLIVIFLWFASPVSSHLISRLEVTTNENIERECEVRD